MDKTILECIEEMYDKGEIGAFNHDNLIIALDDYKKAYNKLAKSDTKYLVGEEVYTNIDKFNLKMFILPRLNGNNLIKRENILDFLGVRV